MKDLKQTEKPKKPKQYNKKHVTIDPLIRFNHPLREYARHILGQAGITPMWNLLSIEDGHEHKLVEPINYSALRRKRNKKDPLNSQVRIEKRYYNHVYDKRKSKPFGLDSWHREHPLLVSIPLYAHYPWLKVIRRCENVRLIVKTKLTQHEFDKKIR